MSQLLSYQAVHLYIAALQHRRALKDFIFDTQPPTAYLAVQEVLYAANACAGLPAAHYKGGACTKVCRQPPQHCWSAAAGAATVMVDSFRSQLCEATWRGVTLVTCQQQLQLAQQRHDIHVDTTSNVYIGRSRHQACCAAHGLQRHDMPAGCSCGACCR